MSERLESKDLLRTIGEGPDHGFDIAMAALHLAALKRTRPELSPFEDHLVRLGEDVSDALSVDSGRSLEAAVGTLARVLAQDHRYCGDDQTYDDLQNADLIHVIERRKGLPVALGILYLHAARAQGWTAYGLNFPGHFLIAVDRQGERAILDPFHSGCSRTPPELRELLKMVAGQDAELNAEMYAPVPDRAVLLRLQSNIQLRLLQMKQYEQAANIIESMLLIAPQQSSLWRDFGLLQAQQGNLTAAIEALQASLVRESNDVRRQETAALLEDLRRRMN